MGNLSMQLADHGLYHLVRGKLVANGTPLNRWCLENGVTRQWAERVLKGQSNGPASIALLERLKAVAEINA